MDYVFIIGTNYPNVQVTCIGDPTVYENLVWADGDPIPAQADLDAAMLAHAQEQMWTNIKAERERRKAGGVHVNYTDATGNQISKWFHSDDASRIQQIALVMMGASIPANLMWKTMDGSFVLMTQALAMQIFQTTALYDQKNFGIAEQHRQAMTQLADPYSYDYSGSWLETYTDVD